MLAADLAFLELGDVESLKLPPLAESVVTSYIKLGMCEPHWSLILQPS